MTPVSSLGRSWPEPATPSTGADPAPAGAPPGPRCLDTPSTLEAFAARVGSEWWHDRGAVEDEPGALPLALRSTPEVEAQAIREARARRDAEAMHAVMGPALRALARGTPDPVGLLGAHIPSGTLAWPRFNDALHSEGLGELTRRLPPAEGRALLQQEVALAWRHRPAGEVSAIADFLAGKVDEHLRLDGTFRMRDEAVAQLRATAASLEALAGAPDRTAELPATLAALAGGRPEEQALARRLREGLGLAGGEGDLPDRLRARAALLRTEADGLARTGFANLPRALAGHEVGEATAQAAGITPGSWAARGLAAAQHRSEVDRERYEAGELLAGFTAVGAAALLGPGGLAGLALATGLEVSTGSIGAGQALREVDRAVAGELAGTMPAGSAAEARFGATVKAATVAVSAVATPALGGALAEGVAASAPGVAHALGHRGLHAAAELAVKAVVEATGHASVALHAHPDAETGPAATGE